LLVLSRDRDRIGVDDVAALVARNDHFIEACRLGSWEMLRQILAPEFSYLDGTTGDVWPMDRYIADLRGSPTAGLRIDQVQVHVAGNSAMVSARTSADGRAGRNRYIDSYERRADGWRCVHACVWPVVDEDA
jgi:hypothetical protein